MTGLPNAVRITLYLDSNPRRTPATEAETPEPPLVFQTVVCLNLAGAVQAAAAATTSGANSGSDAANQNPNPGTTHNMRQEASILVGLLWCLALLSVLAVGVLHTARMDLLVGKNFGDRIQAHYLALAGVEKARALLYQNAQDRSRSRTGHDNKLYDDAGEFRDIALGRGVYRVFRRARPDEGGGIVYGVSDEESRLNLNTATTDELNLLPNMTPDVPAAIVTAGGAATR